MMILSRGGSNPINYILLSIVLLAVLGYFINMKLHSMSEKYSNKPAIVVENYVYKSVNDKGLINIMNGSRLERYSKFDIFYYVNGSSYKNKKNDEKSEFYSSPKVIRKNIGRILMPNGATHQSIEKRTFMELNKSEYDLNTAILSTKDAFLFKSEGSVIVGKGLVFDKNSGDLIAFNLNMNKKRGDNNNVHIQKDEVMSLKPQDTQVKK